MNRMPTWNPGQYLKFAEERTQPCRDLAARIELQPSTIIDLGCGPGNSAEVLADRWPDAAITGLDSSAEMIAAARSSFPQREWLMGDIAQWAAASRPAYDEAFSFDLIFSNAALQWTPDHDTVFPNLFSRVADDGALALQMPGNFDAMPHRLMRELAASSGWRRWFGERRVREWHTHDLDFYYDVFAPIAGRLNIWATEYLHVLPTVEAIVEWYAGTGLRPFLDAIGEAGDRERFLGEYTEALRPHFQPRTDGCVLFPFRRIFIIAYR